MMAVVGEADPVSPMYDQLRSALGLGWVETSVTGDRRLGPTSDGVCRLGRSATTGSPGRSSVAGWRPLTGQRERLPNPHGCRGAGRERHRWRSKRSSSMTWSHAAAKSRTNLSWPSLDPYTSATARSSALEPNTRSAAVAVHCGWPFDLDAPS